MSAKLPADATIRALMRCEEHPRYQVKRKPRALCEACWTQWVFKQYFTSIRKSFAKRVERLAASPSVRTTLTLCGGPPAAPFDPKDHFDGRNGDVVTRRSKIPYDDGRG